MSAGDGSRRRVDDSFIRTYGDSMPRIPLTTLSPEAQSRVRLRAIELVSGGMTQRAAARLLGVSRQSVNSWCADVAAAGLGEVSSKRMRAKVGSKFLRTPSAKTAQDPARRAQTRIIALSKQLARSGAISEAIAALHDVGSSDAITVLRTLARRAERRSDIASALTATMAAQPIPRVLMNLAKAAEKLDRLDVAIAAYASAGDVACEALRSLAARCASAGKYLLAISAYSACGVTAAHDDLLRLGDGFTDYDFAIEAYAVADSDAARRRLLGIGDYCSREGDLHRAVTAYRAAAGLPIADFTERWLSTSGVVQEPASVPGIAAVPHHRRIRPIGSVDVIV